MEKLGAMMETYLSPQFENSIDQAGELAKAIANLPDEKTIHVGFRIDPLPHFDTGPGGVVVQAPGFAEGTHGKFVNFGKGTLAILHGREAIVPKGEAGPGFDAEPLRKELADLRDALLNEQRLAPERLVLAMRGLVALAH